MIHYHGTPLSGGINVQNALSTRHACVSFAAHSGIEAVAEVCQSFILDNGAFSMWTRGQEYDLQEYENFVARWRQHPGCDWHLIPDVIDGGEDDNRKLIEEWPLGGVPVWHLHESLEFLDDLVRDFPRVALGSSAQYSKIGTNQWWSRMAEAMAVICDDEGKPKTKIHGLRMLDPRIFSCFPFSSADSTNVARNIGIDAKWDRAPYAPKSRSIRALILMDRIEAHASASFWDRHSTGQQMSLLG